MDFSGTYLPDNRVNLRMAGDMLTKSTVQVEASPMVNPVSIASSWPLTTLSEAPRAPVVVPTIRTLCYCILSERLMRSPGILGIGALEAAAFDVPQVTAFPTRWGKRRKKFIRCWKCGL